MRIAAVAIFGVLASLGAAVQPAAAGEPAPVAAFPPAYPAITPPPMRAPPPFPPAPFPAGRLRAPPPPVRVFVPGVPSLRPRGEGHWPPHGRICFDQAEAREKIAAKGLADPFRAIRFGRQQGEALSAKLCSWRPNEFVYEIHVLRGDGRVLRVFMNAQNGSPMGEEGGLGHAPGQN